MAISEQEAVASLHVLVAVAQADGSIHDEEKKALAAALSSIEILEGTDVEQFLDEKVNLAQEVNLLLSAEAREETYRSAYGLAHADGACSAEEQAVLDRLRSLLAIDEARASEIRRVFDEGTRAGDAKSSYTKIADDDERQAMVRRLTLKDSIISALLGAFPVPGLAIATDLAVLGIQVNLIRDVSALWGQETDRKNAKALLATFGVGTGARIAVNNLVKVIPGWGSLVGATTSFASTYAVGVVMHKHFQNAAHGNVDVEALKAEFEAAQREGKEAYKARKAEIDAKEKEARGKIAALNEELKHGRITQAEFEERVSAI
jgi:uncharacterized protein (DUF697 family)/uncharacterized tellurite resistance protein B-like protein